MTTKKYIITFMVFAMLLVLTMFLFIGGLLNKEQSEIAFYVFSACSCICLIGAIFYIVVNHRKLIEYDINKLNKKIDNLDFSVLDISISDSELYNRLLKDWYVS